MAGSTWCCSSRRAPPRRSPTLARAAGEGVVNGCGKAAALCLSPAVATAARELPWREVEVAARPELPALLDLIDRELAARAESAGKVDGHATEASSASAEAVAPTIEPPPRRRSRLAAIVVTAAATAAAVALVVNLLWGWLQGPDPALMKRLSDVESTNQWSANGVSVMRDDVGSLIGKMDDVAGRLGVLETAMQNAPSGAAPDLTPLTKRLDALEQEMVALRAAAQQPAQAAPLPDLCGPEREDGGARGQASSLPTSPTSTAPRPMLPA